MAKKFVCVRIQSMNGVNLNQFQFEYDLTWMSFFQNASGRTYARYGGREDHDAESHLNKASLLRVMKQVQALHQEGNVQPANRFEPIPKSVRTPEDIPPMKAMLSKRKVSCIHCHDVKGAQLRHLDNLGKLDKNLVFTYPAPSRLGIHLDPDVQNRVKLVDPKSPAAAAGIRAGDSVRTVAKQRVLTYADFSRVLELTPEEGTLAIDVERNKKTVATQVRLPAGWRKGDDPSWRSSTGMIGPSSGFWGKKADSKERQQIGVSDDGLALKINFIWGQWTRDAGMRQGDIVTSIDGKSPDMTIRQLQAYLHLNRDWGDKIEIEVRRVGEIRKLSMQLPKERPN